MFSPRPQRLCGSLPLGTIPRTVMSEMFNRNAIGVRAHADGVGVKRSNVSSEAVQGIVLLSAYSVGKSIRLRLCVERLNKT